MSTILEICPAPWAVKEEPTPGGQARTGIYAADNSLVAAIATRGRREPGKEADPRSLAVGAFISAAPAMHAALEATDRYLNGDREAFFELRATVRQTLDDIDAATRSTTPEDAGQAGVETNERDHRQDGPTKEKLAGQKLTERRTDAMLAALRLLATSLRNRSVEPNDGEIGDILTSGGRHDGLTIDEIEQLADDVADD